MRLQFIASIAGGAQILLLAPLLAFAQDDAKAKTPVKKPTCTVYVAKVVAAKSELEMNLEAERVLNRTTTTTEILVHDWPVDPELTPEGGLAACKLKARTTCAKAQQKKPGPCRYEVSTGSPRGFGSAHQIVWAQPEAKKKTRKRKRKKKRTRK